MSNEKEKILDRNGFEFEAFKFENEYSAKNLLLAMQEYADQQTSDLQKRIKELEETLGNIINPITYLQKNAEKDGYRLNGGAAIQLIKDPSFYQDLAKKVLNNPIP